MSKAPFPTKRMAADANQHLLRSCSLDKERALVFRYIRKVLTVWLFRMMRDVSSSLVAVQPASLRHPLSSQSLTLTLRPSTRVLRVYMRE
jgi:hypothetical protein